MSQQEFQAVLNDVQVIFEASNVDQQDIELIVSDLVAIVEEFQNRDPLISDAQKENIRTLVSDLQEVASHTTVTPEQAAEVRAEFHSIVDNATRPERSVVRELRGAIRSAGADGQVTDEERQAVAESFSAVLESANITQQARDDLWAEISETGLTRDDVQTVAEDLAAIRQEFRGSRGPVGPRPLRR